MKGDWSNILWTTVTAAIGLGALAAGLTGWLMVKTTMVERLLLIAPSLLQDDVGIGLFGLAGFLQYRRRGAAAVERSR